MPDTNDDKTKSSVEKDVERMLSNDADENMSQDLDGDDSQFFDMSVRFKIIHRSIDEFKADTDTLAKEMNFMVDNVSDLMWKMKNSPPTNNNDDDNSAISIADR